MCRLLAYLGEEAPLGALVAAPPHSLLRQSWQARELAGATVNADGWGAGIYLPGDPRPCLYLSTLPIWADVNLEHVGRAFRSGCMLAAVRSATDPRSVAHANTQPFASGSIAFLHNGCVEGFRAGVRRRIVQALSDARFAEVGGITDSEHLFALILDELDRRGGPGDPQRLLEAAACAVARVGAWAKEAGGDAHFAVVLADGSSVAALRLSTGPQPPSLHYLPAPGDLAPGTIVASEPLDDDPRWRRIPARHGLLVARGAAPRMVELA